MKPEHKEYIKEFEGPPKKKAVFLSVALIIILGFAAYGNSLNGTFIWDDKVLVEENEHIRHWSHLQQLFIKDIGAGAGNQYAFYRPLQMVTYMVDYSLWKLNAKGYHLTNILLHILTALSVSWLIYMIFKDLLLSLLTGSFFVVHPIHTEAVTYVSGRADSLALLFMLLCCVLYIKSSLSKNVGVYILMLCSYALALLSKESSVILPVLLLLYSYSFKKKLQVKEFASLVSLALIYILLRVTVLAAMLPDISSSTSTTLFQRLPGVFVAITTYIRLLFLPLDLHMEYGSGLFQWMDLKAVLGVILLFALLIYALRKRTSDPLVFFSISWFFVALFPVSNIFPINAYMAEHWLYLPSIGFFLIMAKAISVGATLPRRQAGGRPPLLKTLTIIFAMCLLSFYSFLTIRQNTFWKESLTFFEMTLKYAPTSARAHNNIGLAYKELKQIKKAVASYQGAIAIKPDYAEAHYNLGIAYKAAKKNEKAIASFKKAIAINADYAKAYNNLGNIYRMVNTNKEAIAAYKQVIKIDPDYAPAYNNLGAAYASANRNTEAETLFKKAIEIDPNYAEAYHNLGVVYKALDDHQGAMISFKKAIEIKADYPKAHNNLGNAYRAANKREEAIASYKKAIKIDPGYAPAYDNLAAVYIQEKQFKLAIGYCDRANELGLTNVAHLETLKPYR